jgi:hypothetical protein
MVTGGSSHRKAARHFSFAADAQITRYARAVSFGWADVHCLHTGARAVLPFSVI